MKNKLYIIAFVVLFLTSGGIVLFAKKQLDKKRAAKALEEVKESVAEVEEPPSPKRELEKPTQDLNIESDISVDVNTENRSVAYNMHYNGIAIDGIFKEGDKDVVISKSFGFFHIKPGVPTARLMEAEADLGQKNRAGAIRVIRPIPEISISTKGGAAKGKTGAALIKINDTVFSKSGTPIAKITNSNFVLLMIKNTNEQVLRAVRVNLLTGEIESSVQPTNWDID